MEVSELKTIIGIESELNALLINSVDNGASIGFLAPFSSTEAGQIPGFVVNSSGQPEATVYFYKQL